MADLTQPSFVPESIVIPFDEEGIKRAITNQDGDAMAQVIKDLVRKLQDSYRDLSSAITFRPEYQTQDTQPDAADGQFLVWAAPSWPTRRLLYGDGGSTYWLAPRNDCYSGSPYNKLHCVVTGASTLSMSAAYAVLRHTSDATKFILGKDLSKTCDLSGTGANKLDTGTQGNYPYYFYWIGKPDGTIDSIASLNATAPALPAGYEYLARASAIVSSATPALLKVYQQNNLVIFDEEITVNYWNSAQAWTIQALNGWITSWSRQPFMILILNNASGGWISGAIRAYGSSGGGIVVVSCAPGHQAESDGFVPTDSSQQIQLNISNNEWWYLRLRAYMLDL